ncbi:MAG: UDP-N-acetylmuramoyl-L-alanine--D-glutamate ligase [Dehalococcoidia bacterium]|nr:UDP-N-acetylmuramoyl-L-alanine--D-glutamate ligase [Dehalococcoidia bacterium]
MFKSKQVTIIGFGIEGTALARYLASEGALVTISDAKSAESLAANIQRVKGMGIKFSFGANKVEDVLGADMVFVSQGVPLEIPAVTAAIAHGIPINSMTKHFMDACPGTVVGITGSAGKSTTTALMGEVLKEAGRNVFVGGNLGVPLLERLDEMDEKSWAVLEVSHTQLEIFEKSPHVAAVTNIAPSHADRYPNLTDYIDLKKKIFKNHRADDFLVVNYDDAVTRSMGDECASKVLFFSRCHVIGDDGSYVDNGRVKIRYRGKERDVLGVEDVQLRGTHNLENILAVCAMAAACGVDDGDVAKAVSEFAGIGHRLEMVRILDDVSYYNDSIATSPQRTLAGLHSFNEPVVLIAGGRDKHLPLDELAQETAKRCRAVVLYGEAAEILLEAFIDAGMDSAKGVIVRSFGETVSAARRLARAGDIVLMSPACTSFDVFENFEQRGDRFRELVMNL